MTETGVVVPAAGQPGSGVAPYDPDEYENVGLEDVGIGDIVIPRLQIQHADGTFKDNLSGMIFPNLKVVLLGLVKQRIMWDDEVDEGDKPMCKSPDFEHGFPQTRDDVPASKRFPWADSNFDPANFPPEAGMNGNVTLPCGSCIFKEWDKGNWKKPPCNEQHTYALLYTPDEGTTWVPALLTLQSSGIKPSKNYITYFAQSKTPLFTVYTEITLTQASRGSVTYSTPNLKRLDATPRENWNEYATNARAIRDFIRQPPRAKDEDDEGDFKPATGDAAASTGTPGAPVPEAAPAAVPVTPPPTAATPAAPVAETPPAATPAPVPAAAVAAPAATAEPEDDLPF